MLEVPHLREFTIVWTCAENNIIGGKEENKETVLHRFGCTLLKNEYGGSEI